MNNMKIPIPKTINFLWNFGSMLGLCLTIQIISGFLLAMRYSADSKISFMKTMFIMDYSWNGYNIRNLHTNGASMFFISMYMHIGRGMMYHSFYFYMAWFAGIMLFLISMGTAFLGYVLPWGQMSFWGASVITSLISSMPYLGVMTTMWVWGEYSISNPTITRFFTLHFILPFLIMMIMLIHLSFIHISGSNNPLNTELNKNKIYFTPYFIYKDLIYFIYFFMIIIILILFLPYFFLDSSNFLNSNPMITPEHILPEWYFLFAYAILRSIKSKLGGVIALLMSILILLIMPFYNNKQINNLFIMNKNIMFSMYFTFLVLTLIGMKTVEFPYIEIGMMFSLIYFSLFIIIPYNNSMIYKFI